MKRERHDKQYTRLYIIWKNMKSRCNNPNRRDYRFYGERGIRVCDEWNQKFSSFLEWALIAGYTDSLTIERLDPAKGYSPDNCTWISRSLQGRNKINTAMLTVGGITRPVWEWARIYESNVKRIQARIKLGWSAEDAVMTGKNEIYVHDRYKV